MSCFCSCWWWFDGGKRLLKQAYNFQNQKVNSKLESLTMSRQSRGSQNNLFIRQTSINDYLEKVSPRPSTTTTLTSPLNPSIDTFLLFNFYGISLSSSLNPLSPFRITFLWTCRLLTLGSMLFLLGSTGSSAFTKDDSTERLLGNSSTGGGVAPKSIPALSSLNLKFYYRLSFHLKSYFCLLSYLYVLLRTSAIRQVVLDIIVRLNEKTGDGRRLIVVRRILAVVWAVNVAANGAFFAWNAIDVELSSDLEVLGGWSKLIEGSSRSQLQQKVALCLLKELLWAFYGFGWLITGVLFMIWITYANYLVEVEVFRRQLRLVSYKSILATSGENSLAELLLASARPPAELPKYRSLLPLYTALQTLTCLQESINAHLGLLPFFWLCELFLSTCLRITQVALLAGVRPSGGPNGSLAKLDKSLRSTIEYHLEYFVEYLVLTAFYVAFIAIVEWFASQRVTLYQLERALLDAVDFENSKNLNGVQNSRWNCQGSYVFQGRVVGPSVTSSDWLNSRTTNSQQQNQTLVLLTVAVAHKYIDSRYMAWCKFNLNYRLVFAFINAAAPFSVMILQLHG